MSSEKSDSNSVAHFWKTVGLAGIAAPVLAAAIAGTFSLVVYQRGQVQVGPFSVQKTTPLPTAQSTTAPTPIPTSAGISYQGPTSLTSVASGGEGRSLDGLPTSNSSPFDISLYPQQAIYSVSGARLALWTGTQPPSRQDCLTAVATQSQPIVTARQGVEFCVETNNKRYAYVRVVASDGQTAQLDVTVWDKPS